MSKQTKPFTKEELDAREKRWRLTELRNAFELGFRKGEAGQMNLQAALEFFDTLMKP
jgi:hypothetical protein